MSRSPVSELQKIDLGRQANPAGATMRMPSHHRLTWFVRLADVVSFVVVYSVLYVSRTGELNWHLFESRRFAAIAVVLMAALWLTEAHRVDHTRPAWGPGLRVLSATGLAGLILGVLVYLVGPELLGQQYNVLGRSIVLPTLAVFSGVAILLRLHIWRWLNRVSVAARWLMLAGAADPGVAEFWREFVGKHKGSLNVLVDQRTAEANTNGPSVVGTWQDIPTTLREPWSGVLLSSHATLPDVAVRELLHARIHGMPVLQLADFYEQYWSRVPVTHLQGEWFALSRGFDLLHSPIQTQAKRVSDVLLAGGLLLIAAPVMVLVAVAVALDSRGPVLFKQARVGRHGIDFTCLKFRTMRVRHASDDQGSKYTEAKDKRITRIGGFLRTTRLDELPQLFNVLAGHMSFIGPRAEWNELVKGYEHELPYYHLRHLVRPGLTGWAQVNYPYGANLEDTRMKLEYDLYYIKFYSLYLDLVIILRTVRVCLFGLGAR